MTPASEIPRIDAISLFEERAPLLHLGAASETPPLAHIRIGIDQNQSLSIRDAEDFDLLLTLRKDAPRPWVTVTDIDETVAALRGNIEKCPIAAVSVVQILRMSERVTFKDAVLIESFAYSSLLAGGEFAEWRALKTPRPVPHVTTPLVNFERDADHVTITLQRIDRRNAFSAQLRDQLVDALTSVLIDPSRPHVVLQAIGPAFCAGGDLDEFGSSRNLADAHAIRSTRSSAVLVHALGDRIEARIHGACIGAGIEIPASAHKVIARPDAFMQLPEIMMGLVPGAGGCASLPRRIGRHRSCFVALSASRIDADTALNWGLVDEISP